jgi:hypothetical protein
MLVPPVSLQAQTAHFSGAQSPLGSELSSPGGVAVDSSGNVYIAATSNSRILKETLAPESYTPSSWCDGDRSSENPLIFKKSFVSLSRYGAGAHNNVQS